MMYLLLKELSTKAGDTIIAFATLIRDVNSDVEMHRANAIRVISGIMDSTMLSQMERYLKQAIVDKEPYVASSALVAGVHLFEQSPDVIKRWVTEVQEALNSRSVMVQYHALGLLHKIKRRDRLAVAKLVSALTESGALRSHYAHCLLIRFVVEVMTESPTKDERLFNYLENCLRHRSEIVVYEAARAICNLPGITSQDLSPAVTVLQVLLSSPRPALRFAAVRTLNKVANTNPDAIVAACAYEMENLISDTNRSVATLAITTLLKVETESSVERLMIQINNFINDLSDEFKVVVVDAIRTLSLKYPDKHYNILNFLSTMLREEGGLDYKSAIVSTILSIIEKVPSSTDVALDHLCEFIEDCEFTNLSTKILHLLGDKGPVSSNPSRYIRYIYNRIALENPTVRASAVSALAKFGIKRPELRSKIRILLKRSLLDNDDEVRDRASFNLRMIDGDEEADIGLASALILDSLHIPLENLQTDLVTYLEQPTQTPFDISAVSRKLKPKTVPETVRSTEQFRQEKPRQEKKPAAQTSYAAELHTVAAIREMELGDLLNSSSPVQLTEADAAYRVNVVKHLFRRHTIFQYNITNTIPTQLLKNVTVEIGSDDDHGFSVAKIVPCESISCDETSEVYVVISRPQIDEDYKFHTCSFWNNMLFKTHDVDAQTGEADVEGFADEFPLDDVEFAVNDYIRKNPLPNFGEVWQNTESQPQSITTFSLSTVNNIKEGVAEMIRFFGLAPCDGSETVTEASKSKHILYLSGTYVEKNINIVVRVRMRFSPQQGVGMELTVRSESEQLNESLANAMFN
eukprot:TRINITY_DN4391_c0_g1_i1.p2 TRINITY_DN4391_c0_g1~~TRINITY_DN4391_c0_g1_i1.p2  ORF type:complete len:805 (-),score=190.65 TRINITY_DN4391_c0_g1_i1:2803-5217(-)